MRSYWPRDPSTAWQADPRAGAGSVSPSLPSAPWSGHPHHQLPKASQVFKLLTVTACSLMLSLILPVPTLRWPFAPNSPVNPLRGVISEVYLGPPRYFYCINSNSPFALGQPRKGHRNPGQALAFNTTHFHTLLSLGTFRERALGILRISEEAELDFVYVDVPHTLSFLPGNPTQKARFFFLRENSNPASLTHVAHLQQPSPQSPQPSVSHIIPICLPLPHPSLLATTTSVCQLLILRKDSWPARGHHLQALLPLCYPRPGNREKSMLSLF